MIARELAALLKKFQSSVEDYGVWYIKFLGDSGSKG
jgi:hypothetical protein